MVPPNKLSLNKFREGGEIQIGDSRAGVYFGTVVAMDTDARSD